MYVIISVCALAAIVACAVGVCALALAVSANSRSKTTQAAWETSKPAKVTAEVADLADALAAHKRAQRAELGRLWARLSPAASREAREREDEPPAELMDRLIRRGPPSPFEHGDDRNQLDFLDPQLEATLALQRAPASSPGPG